MTDELIDVDTESADALPAPPSGNVQSIDEVLTVLFDQVVHAVAEHASLDDGLNGQAATRYRTRCGLFFDIADADEAAAYGVADCLACESA